MKKCMIDKCKNSAQDTKNLCAPCNYEKQKKDDIFKRTWFTLRNNCKRRGVEFNLTLDEFTKLVKKNHYINQKGIGKYDLQIIRIDTKKGYSIDNVSFKTNSETRRAQKQSRELKILDDVKFDKPSSENTLTDNYFNEKLDEFFDDVTTNHPKLSKRNIFHKVVTVRSYLWGLIKVTVTKWLKK